MMYEREVICALILSIVGHLLQSGECVTCPSSCTGCDRPNTCYGCQQNYWNVSASCIPCPSYCVSDCSLTTGRCGSCIAGYYGDHCSQPCSLCKNNQCGRDSCTDGCKDGYFQDNYQGSSVLCRECSNNCVKCSNLNKCTQCEPSYYMNKYNASDGERTSCLKCVLMPPCSNCLNADICLSCENIANCQQCKTDGLSYNCIQCNDNFVVLNGSCVASTPCSTCFKGCSDNGTCMNGCLDGFSGTYCERPCNSVCQTCSQSDPNYCKKCKGNRYLRNCGTDCKHCMKIDGQSTCDIDNGTCLNGCAHKFWGSNCEINCSPYCAVNASAEVCKREDGECLHGCQEGYMGLKCNTVAIVNTPITDTTLENTTSKPSRASASAFNRQEGHSSLAVGIGVGVGLSVLVAVVIVAIIMLRRRRRHKNASSPTENSPQKVSTCSDLENLFEKPKKEMSHSVQDYIYAQPNKARKTELKSEVSERETNIYNTITIDTDSDTDQESNIDEPAMLEDIDDGEAVSVQNACEDPQSDTYYNTERLLRSRIAVSNLLDYIRSGKEIAAEFEKIPKGLTRPCHEALKPSNRGKNRYNGIYAYDATRVVLRSKEYINACFIDGKDGPKTYIASLGPTKTVMPEFAVFWEMVWQENSRRIVMLTNLVENDKMKCEQYWPDERSARRYGDVCVTFHSENVYAEFLVREFRVRKGSETRKVTQYHYTAWPDKSVPDSIASLLEFRDFVEKKQVDSTGPMIVHCSAGIGRTGTYIALDMLINEGKNNNSVDIFGCVSALRGQRVNMVQNLEQYIYLHHCVTYALTCNCAMITEAKVLELMTDGLIQEQFQNYSCLHALSTKEGADVHVNKKRKENRKGADIPGDRHRVKLIKKEYVNAVYVDGFRFVNQFIAAQNPMPNSLDEFVSMMYQESVKCIVSLDDETSIDKTIAHYIPEENKPSMFGQFQLSVVRTETEDAFICRELKLAKIGNPQAEIRSVMHYQVKGWEKGDDVPENVANFIRLVTAVTKATGQKRGNVLVNCIDGAQRSGMFCAIANMIEKLSVEKRLSILNTVCLVQARRRNALQSVEQFKFCCNCVKYYLETIEAKTYYNVL